MNMRHNFSVVVCTYMRPKPLLKLLKSIKLQTTYPDEILIIDGSIDDHTEKALKENIFKDLKYFRVKKEDRGLTRQRNFGINQVHEKSQVICFLDDDTVLENNYFEELISTYNSKNDALAVGGYIINENSWSKEGNGNPNKFHYDGWNRDEPMRFKVRKLFGLLPDVSPGFMPSFSHGRSVGFLPPSGKIYEVEQIMGGVSSFKKKIFNEIRFSTYFEGYGLYEDSDFSLRLAKKGKIYVNTDAKLYHYHDVSGRPNKFKYGKMVVRNGWYVWRIKYPEPTFKARFKWNTTSLLLTIIRFSNVINTSYRKEAFTESLGRLAGWFSLLYNKPKFEK